MIKLKYISVMTPSLFVELGAHVHMETTKQFSNKNIDSFEEWGKQSIKILPLSSSIFKSIY